MADRSKAEYMESIESCLEHIGNGETYEVCLTTQFQGKYESDHHADDISDVCNGASASVYVKRSEIFQTYRDLRDHNGAPYSCFFHYDPGYSLSLQNASTHGSGKDLNMLRWYKPGGISILSSSPERYLKADKEGNVESKPIKGTARRDLIDLDNDEAIKERLRCDEKSRAENLMIVDLVRNDFGRVCDVSSVSVSSLMHVESYASVHQLVSTIRGHLAGGRSLVDAIVSTFPGGSMTGAPKIRTMEIIDELEQRRVRGVYAGAMGYIGMNGMADLSIVIRTALIAGGNITIASGGAIVALSDPQEEVDEVHLKASAVGSALGYDIEFA